MKRWLKYFDLSQFYFADGEKLITEPVSELRAIEKFLNLTPTFTEDNFVYVPKKGFFSCLYKMSTFALELVARLENVTNLRPIDYFTYKWIFKIECSSCNKTNNEWYYACPKEFQAINGDKVHMKDKCPSCGQNYSIEILENSYRPYRIERNNEHQSIVKFYCHGLELVDFNFDLESGWIAESTNSKAIFDVDMELEKWADYDERAGIKVKISEVDFRFTPVKKF
uniref:Uncharacterized protein n=1 Tax=Acrobeloides nanus TaxID=290746 RepID=A0A914EF71_9BILA